MDPLDGTREFGEAGRSDWAVHVALVIDGTPVAGAVALPALGTTLATDDPPATPLRSAAAPRLVVSRSRPPALASHVAAAMGGELVPLGSAGAKAMAVVRGDADIYVHGGGQYEWDSAAPVAVALAAGVHCSRLDGSPLVYNCENPWLPDLVICRADLAEAVLAAVAAAPARTGRVGSADGRRRRARSHRYNERTDGCRPLRASPPPRPGRTGGGPCTGELAAEGPGAHRPRRNRQQTRCRAASRRAGDGQAPRLRGRVDRRAQPRRADRRRPAARPRPHARVQGDGGRPCVERGDGRGLAGHGVRRVEDGRRRRRRPARLLGPVDGLSLRRALRRVESRASAPRCSGCSPVTAATWSAPRRSPAPCSSSCSGTTSCSSAATCSRSTTRSAAGTRSSPPTRARIRRSRAQFDETVSFLAATLSEATAQ